MARRPTRPSPPPPPAARPPVALVGAVVAAVVAIAAVVLYLAVRGGDAALESTGSASALPEGGGVVVSDATGVPQVHLYEDFQCPWCGVLERAAGADLDEAAAQGRIGLTVTLMSFLDDRVGNDSSTRAANAALCADDQGAFPAYRSQVFEHQPEEEGTGWTDEELVGFAEAAGVPDLATFRSCLDDSRHAGYVADMQERANRDGISGTPRLLVDGEAVSDDELRALMEQPGALEQILQARQ